MIEQIMYVQIPVKNIRRSVAWYRDVLELQFIWHMKNEKLAQLNFSSGQMLFLLESKDASPIQFEQNGREHGVIGLQTIDIYQLYERLKSYGIQVTEIDDDGQGNLFLDFTDIDGNRFNVQCDASNN
ncbi:MULTISPECIES: VOC family protein [Sporosarcina]|uniref:VOC family protein n=1 Tax=Sporosarcina contaminans TaxID=633403 RepID=A0ABW3TXT6_9BACL